MSKTSKTKAPKKKPTGLKAVKVPAGYVNEGSRVPYAGQTVWEEESVTTTKLTGTTDTTSFDQKLTDLGFTKPVDFGNRIVDLGKSPFMRANTLTVNARAFMPNAKLYPFFDDVLVQQYCREVFVDAFGVPTGLFGAYGADLVTNGKGAIRIEFALPGEKFKTGDRVFRFTTSPTNESSPPPASFAETKYHAVGYVGHQQKTSYSVRVPKVDITMTQTSNPNEISASRTAFDAPCVRDPIAQSFFIYEQGGCFVTSVDVFFYAKPTDPAKPTPSVMLQLRELDDGGNPSNKIVPFGQIVKDVDDVITNNVDLVLGRLTVVGNETITAVAGVTGGPWNDTTEVQSETGTAITSSTPIALSANPVDDMIPTRFTFESPIYLSQNTSYCFVLLSDSDEYKVWVAQSGPDITSREDSSNELWRKAGEPNTNIGTSDPISKDPYIQGIFFKSQNGISWTPDQSVDIKFAIWKAEFDTAINGEVVFVNNEIAKKTLPLDAIETEVNSSVVRIMHPHHGMIVSPYARVVLSGISGGTNGLNLTTLQDPAGHELISAELDFYTIDLLTTTTALSKGRFGGTTIKATENKRFEELLFLSNPLVLPETNVTWSLTPTSSKGVNEYVNAPYTILDSFNIEANTTLSFDRPMQISSEPNERYGPGIGPSPVATNGLGDRKSLHLTAIFSSDNKNISPVLDTTRISVVLNDFRLDDPAGNIPLGSSVNSSQVINTTFDQKQIVPSTEAPALTNVDLHNKIYFSTSKASLTGLSVTTTGLAPTTMTGIGTIFLSELEAGDTIKDSVSGEERTVIAITDNTTLTIDSAFSTPLAGVAPPYHDPNPLRLKTADFATAVHLSKLGVGKLVSIQGADGDRSTPYDVYVLEVNYTPNNTESDSDLGNVASKCDVVLDYRPKQAAGFQATNVNPLIITQRDRFVDEISPGGGSCSSKYICKKMSLLRPANALRIMFDGHRDETNDIVCYYRLDTDQDQTPLEYKNWTLAEYNIDTGGQLATLTPAANGDSEEFSSYEVNLLDVAAFSGAQVKLVFRGGNPARIPRVKNFRIIATEE